MYFILLSNFVLKFFKQQTILFFYLSIYLCLFFLLFFFYFWEINIYYLTYVRLFSNTLFITKDLQEMLWCNLEFIFFQSQWFFVFFLSIFLYIFFCNLFTKKENDLWIFSLIVVFIIYINQYIYINNLISNWKFLRFFLEIEYAYSDLMLFFTFLMDDLLIFNIFFCLKYFLFFIIKQNKKNKWNLYTGIYYCILFCIYFLVYNLTNHFFFLFCLYECFFFFYGFIINLKKISLKNSTAISVREY